MAVTIRPAVPNDAAAMANAHMRGWQVAYEGMVPQPFLDAIDLSERTEMWHKILTGELFVEGIERPQDYVAVADRQVVGFANVGPWRDEPADATSGELWAMYVHPDAWDIGAGYALMGATIEYLLTKAYERAYLWVLEENERARRFYKRQGWVCDEVTRDEPIEDFVLVERRYSISL